MNMWGNSHYYLVIKLLLGMLLRKTNQQSVCEQESYTSGGFVKRNEADHFSSRWQSVLRRYVSRHLFLQGQTVHTTSAVCSIPVLNQPSQTH